MLDHQEGEAWDQIEAEYARLGRAVGNKDLDAIRSVHAPEYKELQVSGEERDLEDVMAEWHDDLGAMIEPSFQVTIDSVDLDANKANVIARCTQTFVSSPFPSLRFNVRIETTGCDFWIKSDGGWHLARSERQLTRSWLSDKLDRERRFEAPLTVEERLAIVRDLGVHVLPFKTVLAGNGSDDLAGLDGLIGDARIVALGEASHGTAEVFQMKHRLLEYLVENKGFTVFAIEGNWPEGQVADRFIRTGEGTSAAALAAMDFWTWCTEEVCALVDWMRAYNMTRGKRPELSFAGFDMQFAGLAITRVADFLGRTSTADRDALRQLYDGLEKLAEQSRIEVPPAEKMRLRDNAAQALELIDAHREALIEAATPEAYRDARQAARIVSQFTKMHAGILWAERDAAMAENVRWLLDEGFPGQKIVLWAHNGHVGTAPIAGDKSLGGHLRACYGDQMVVIGFASHHGEVRAKRMAAGKFQPDPPAPLLLPPAQKRSVEALFCEADLPRFILDLRRIAKDSALGKWLAKARPHRSIGAGYDPDRDSGNYDQVCLPEAYDAIVFIAESTPAKPLSFGVP